MDELNMAPCKCQAGKPDAEPAKPGKGVLRHLLAGLPGTEHRDGGREARVAAPLRALYGLPEPLPGPSDPVDGEDKAPGQVPAPQPEDRGYESPARGSAGKQS